MLKNTHCNPLLFPDSDDQFKGCGQCVHCPGCVPDYPSETSQLQLGCKCETPRILILADGLDLSGLAESEKRYDQAEAEKRYDKETSRVVERSG